MKKFKFKFDSLMKLRENERDLHRQLLATLLRRDEELLGSMQQVESERNMQLDDLRQLGSPGQVDIDGSASRRFYAGQLIGDIGGIERSRALLAGQIAHCRRTLIEADRGVKALEKLAEKEKTEFLYEQERHAARELEDGWRAVHSLAPNDREKRTC